MDSQVEIGTDEYKSTEGWLILVNIIHDSTPIIIRKLFSIKASEDSECSEKLHNFITKNEDKLKKVDASYVRRFQPENLLNKIELYKLKRILKSLLPNKWKDHGR